MNALKRNFVLSNKHASNNAMALLTLEKSHTGIVGTLKTYQLPTEDDIYLGIACNKEQIFLQPVTLKNGTFSFSLQESVDLSQSFGCVIMVKNDDAVTPLIWDASGESMKTAFTQAVMPQQPKTIPLNKKEPLNLDEMFELEDANTLEKLVNQSVDDNPPLFEETKPLKEKMGENQIFYDMVSGQIEDLFNKYPAVEPLEQLISGSKWVKVDYENNGNYYVLGLIYDDVHLKYICYGVPGAFDQSPPKELEAYSQWLPLNPDDVSQGGYWVMYQDAITGDNVQIELI